MSDPFKGTLHCAVGRGRRVAFAAVIPWRSCNVIARFLRNFNQPFPSPPSPAPCHPSMQRTEWKYWIGNDRRWPDRSLSESNAVEEKFTSENDWVDGVLRGRQNLGDHESGAIDSCTEDYSQRCLDTAIKGRFLRYKWIILHKLSRTLKLKIAARLYYAPFS